MDSSSKCFLSTYYVSGPVVGARDASKTCWDFRKDRLVGKVDSKQENNKQSRSFQSVLIVTVGRRKGRGVQEGLSKEVRPEGWQGPSLGKKQSERFWAEGTVCAKALRQSFRGVLRCSKEACGWSPVREEERRRGCAWRSTSTPLCRVVWPLQGLCMFSEEGGSHGRKWSGRGTGSAVGSNRIPSDVMVS